ncbi:hypothetical protein JCM16814_01660 [Desulfobaculum senezii]
MFQRVIAFGDSFSDNGFSNGSGFNRLSNGPVWVEHLAARLGVALEDRAWCGAQSGHGNASGPKDWSGLAWQVETFDDDSALPQALCTVLIGINDIYEGDADAGDVAANTIDALERLAAKGMRTCLISTLPDITLAPAYAGEYAHVKAEVAHLVVGINAKLSAELHGAGGFSERHPEVTLHAVDAYGLFNTLAASGTFEISDAPWLGTYSYPKADGFMWWDDWHPMTATHRYFADAAYKVIRGERDR